MCKTVRIQKSEQLTAKFSDYHEKNHRHIKWRLAALA